MRALPFARASDRLQLVVLRLALLRLALPSCLLLLGCAQSSIAGDEASQRDSATSPASGVDGGLQTLDAAAGSRADADDGGCLGGSCQVFDCPDGQVSTACGCDAPDSDGDGTPDCADQCPTDRNKKLPGGCGCGASDLDTDLDGVPDCTDKCSGKANATYVPDASCGVGYCRSHNRASTCVNGVEAQCKAGEPLTASDATCDGIDDDCDGQVDEDYGMQSSSCGRGACARTGTVSCVAGKVVDSCVAGAAPAADDDTCDGIDDDCDGDLDEDYPDKMSSCAAGACASKGVISCSGGKVVDSCSARAQVSSDDATCNNVDEDCDGKVDEDYKSSATKCGVGACAATGTTSCSKGKVVDSCKPAQKASNDDTSCNNVDDDCNGKVDDAFAASPTQCGQGVCTASGTLTCANGGTNDSCVAGQPTSSSDDAFVPGNGLDDNCNGKVDEDVPTCDTTPLTFEAGSHDVAVPGNCRSVSVALWGGGGAGGQDAGGGGGAGGPGGFISASALISGAIKVSVGGGGASGCNAAGGNAETNAYNGGSGAGGSGDPGGDGNAPGGGAGAAPNNGQRGGAGHFGGGGGGAGNGGFLGASGDGGGGGAASVLTINGVRAAVAGGGGGGGGGAQGGFFGAPSSRGGAGGSGCAADGRAETSAGGGGGGGGLCTGASTQPGSGVTPASSDRLPNGRARGGSSSCNAGGAGYAILTFSP